MQALIAGIVAAFVGIFVGFWLRSTTAKAEKAQTDQLAQRNRELTGELAAQRSELTRIQAESAARAGFESLAHERENSIRQLHLEREALQQSLNAKSQVEQEQAAAISRLETALKNERDQSQEKLKLRFSMPHPHCPWLEILRR